MSNRWRRVAIAAVLPAAVVLTLVGSLSASAAEMVSDTGTLSAFASGDVGKWKAAAERDPSNYKWRSVVNVWCDNSAGGAVNCDLIEGTNVNNYLWQEPAGQNDEIVSADTTYLDAANTHLKRFELPWTCEGTVLSLYRSEGENLQVTSRFGEVGTAKDRDSGQTASFYGGCA